MAPSKQILILFLILIPTIVLPQQSIQKHEKKAVIESIKVLIDSNYVLVDKVQHVNNSLDNLHQKGEYHDIKDYKDFAKALSEDLVRITNDKHFLVSYNPELIKSRRARRERMNTVEAGEEQQDKEQEEEEYIDWNEFYARKENFSFQKVEILDGNIGYIKLTFWQPLDWVKPTIDAAMGFVTNTDALIIDLTNNQGGYSPTESYLGSFFFDDEPTVWMSSYDRSTGETAIDSTFQEIGGERYLNKPVFILVSQQTFSLAEKFAYSMKHFDKATIVGQVSAGAAHAINFLEVNDNFVIQIPVLYNIHPITKTDWEGTGVQPDINANKDETLKVAHLEALDRLIDSSEYERMIKRYKAIKLEVNKR